MLSLSKNQKLSLPLLLIVLMCAGCASNSPITPPPAAEPVAPPRMPALDSALSKKPLDSGMYLQRAQKRRSAMLENLKISPLK